MEIAIRYQSRGGNTKAVAEAIGSAVGVEAQPISEPIEEPVDILFVGGGIYGWTIDDSLKNYLETLDPNIVKSVAAFSTAGVMSGIGKIAAIAKTKGIKVCEETLSVKVGLRNHSWFGGKGHIDLTEKQLQKIESFAKLLIAE